MGSNSEKPDLLTVQKRSERCLYETKTLIERMGPDARQVFVNEILPELRAGKIPSVLDELFVADYRVTPIGIGTFITDPHYLGSTLQGYVFPRIAEDLEELFEGDYTEVLLTGGIGWGKTRMAEIGIAYELYQVSCLLEPAATFGLMPGSTLAFINVSVTLFQAKRVLFGGLFDLIRRSPYFRQEFRYEPNIQSEIRFPSNIICYPVASNEQSLLGEGVFSAAFDEMNFMPIVEHSKHAPEGGTYDHAVRLYNRLSRRIRSRLNRRGRLPGHLWLISSARYPNDFTERKAAEAKTDKRIFVRAYPSWGTRPRTYFLPETFKVEVGDTTKRSRVLDGSETNIIQERVIEVPVDFKEEFEKDPDGAVRDYAGISVLTIRPFLARRDLVARMFQLGEEHGLRHPFSKLDVTLQDESDFLLPQNLHWVEEDRNEKKGRRLYSALYFAHVDLARINDACGVAIGHVVGPKQVRRGHGPDAKIETKPLVRMDLVLRVVAPPRGEILAANVRGLFYQLTEQGMQFGKITYDSFGSMESIQTLRGKGFKADTFSVDADTSAYDQLKSAIYDERMICYRVPKLEEELVNLELDEKRHKIDHRPRGSKDLADCLAAVVVHCEANFLTAAASRAAFQLGIVEVDREDLWAKVERGEPLTEEEIDRL